MVAYAAVDLHGCDRADRTKGTCRALSREVGTASRVLSVQEVSAPERAGDARDCLGRHLGPTDPVNEQQILLDGKVEM